MNALGSGERRRLVRQLIGPGGPGLTCEECFEQLDRYVEMELAGLDADAAVPGMRAHLDGCLACEEDRESMRALLVDDAGGGARS